MEEKLRCSDCGKFMRFAFDSFTVFGCANPEAPEPYDPEFFCRKCSNKMYKELLKGYQCCKRSGDYEKSKAEIRAAKEAGLVWVHSGGLVEKSTGREIHYEYIREVDRNWRYMPYLEYQKKRREENRCKCWRKKNEKGECPTCSRDETYCVCKYSSYDGNF